jgi:peptide deformylase
MDLAIAQDLLDTLAAHADHCVGLAANMIGVQKCIIAVNVGPTNIAMLNPEIVKRSGKYMTQEGCLSLTGERTTVRYEKITVRYLDMQFKPHKQSFSGFTAQIIQHEIDHCQGIII